MRWTHCEKKRTKDMDITVYDFISDKENSTGKLFEKWSLTQLGEYMHEYAKLASEGMISKR